MDKTAVTDRLRRRLRNVEIMTATSTGVTRAVIAALIIGVIAALAPAWQLARLDPARVFRS